jgi:hypothetical protein
MFCSLKTEVPQTIPTAHWTVVKFEEENEDASGWHTTGSGCIIPNITTVGLLVAMVQWDSGGAMSSDSGTQTSIQFARDPYDPALIDTTATSDRVNSTGKDFSTNAWPITIRAGQPLALRVYTDAPTGRVVSLAEFKVWVP